jgi:ribonuclease D
LERWAWAEEECRKLEKVRHTQVDPDPLAFERVKGARSLRGAARDRLYSLYEWRDQQARSRDIPPFKILGNKALMAMAEHAPSNLEELGEIEGVGPRAVRRWGRNLFRMIARPRRSPERVRPPKPPTPDASERKRLKRLLAARDARAGALGIQAGLLCPRGVAEAVASHRPPCGTRRELDKAGLEGWRLMVVGDDFLEVISED